ncbi:hypothetical protein BD779DRAFT_1390921, partial [Infundibulicybe gibba]
DFHQFPPVGYSTGALYCVKPSDTPQALAGRGIYKQFDTVVILKEQKRISDLSWKSTLDRLRIGECTEQDLETLHGLVLTNPSCDVPNFGTDPWSTAILVTTRHCVRNAWNVAALIRHCCSSGNRRYCSTAEDTIRSTGDPINNYIKKTIVGLSGGKTGKLNERVELAVGMRAMVILNIATEADLANGTRGTVVRIFLDPRE